MSEALAATVSPDDAALERRLIELTQQGLPLVPHPYHQLADRLDVTAGEVMEAFRRMQASGVVRRIAAVPNHYRLGFRGNGMSVWDIPDGLVREAGREIGALDFVSHCYIRPRALPDWPYNLFAMVHGRNHDAVYDQVARIADMLGERVQHYDVLFSTEVLKKTGYRSAATKTQRRGDAEE
ncbi:protein NirH [Thiohalobacter sp. COW1]|uniref:siroheme decarboxylase n=1 Tax=Thiohalobacter thiocyanaticus TaxID=585455 RepID=A0A1Z4VMN0_9GAMM|nr:MULTISPECIES: Lrp/AsnC family transcriptional regulator [Thiohalobacter]BAZ92870.1 transcriptional regulator [Thiohalobacter thiocyanaticus]BCO32169.1 protein NirH [Thiohalobacter sp. COW1]